MSASYSIKKIMILMFQIRQSKLLTSSLTLSCGIKLLQKTLFTKWTRSHSENSWLSLTRRTGGFTRAHSQRHHVTRTCTGTLSRPFTPSSRSISPTIRRWSLHSQLLRARRSKMETTAKKEKRALSTHCNSLRLHQQPRQLPTMKSIQHRAPPSP